MSLGKTVVHCKDWPGFIGNRLGVYWLQTAVQEALKSGLTVEEADAILGKPMGIPKTGVFGLLDLVGLDLMPHITASMGALLVKDDPFHHSNKPVPVIAKMISEGYTGRKGKGGFYRLNREKGKRKEAIDLTTGEYRDEQKPEILALTEAGKSLVKLLSHDSKHGQYGWAVMGKTLAYAAALVGEVSDHINAIDEAMRLGFNWKFGPFELIDQLGSNWFVERLSKEGSVIPKFLTIANGRPIYRFENSLKQVLGFDGKYHTIQRPDGIVLLEDIKRNSQPVLKNGSAALWDVGDGVAWFEFTSKMNSLDVENMLLIHQSIQLVKENFKALVIYNDSQVFSAGANLGLVTTAAKASAWSEIENIIKVGQRAFLALKYAPFPVVAAPSGIALGGGCEIVLAVDAVQAHAELNMGLVEVSVGLIPAWGGCKEMLHRWATLGGLSEGPMPAVIKAFEIISQATVSKSAADAKALLFLRTDDGITMNRDRLLADAKAKALLLVKNYQPPKPMTFNLPGPSARQVIDRAIRANHKLGKATDYDLVVLGELADILSGGDTDFITPLTEHDVLALECEHFMNLVRDDRSVNRIAHMLETGTPLRN